MRGFIPGRKNEKWVCGRLRGDHGLQLGGRGSTFSACGLFEPGGRLGQPSTSSYSAPEEKAKLDAFSALLDIARAHEDEGRWPAAEIAFREAHTYGTLENLGFESTTQYGIARMLQSQQKDQLALEAHKRSLSWSQGRSDWSTNGPMLIQVFADFAILAAEQGERDLAIEVYTAGLRSLSRESTGDERIPLLVTFEPSPGMTHWEYSADRMKAAAMALSLASMRYPWEVRKFTPSKHLDPMKQLSPDYRQVTLARIKQLAPEWYWPYAYEAFAPDYPSYPTAESLCKNDQERAWLRRFASGDKTIPAEAAELRKNCPVIQRRNRDLLPNAVVVD